MMYLCKLSENSNSVDRFKRYFTKSISDLHMKTLSSPSIHASLVEIQHLVQDIDELEHLGRCEVLQSGHYVIQRP